MFTEYVPGGRDKCPSCNSPRFKFYGYHQLDRFKQYYCLACGLYWVEAVSLLESIPDVLVRSNFEELDNREYSLSREEIFF